MQGRHASLAMPAALLLGSLAASVHAQTQPWREGAGYTFRPVAVSASGRVGFESVPATQTGVSFSNRLSDELLKSDSSLLSGSGVTLGDFDGDRLCDIYLCSLAGENALYRNLGNWRFEDVTRQAGVDCAGQICRGAVFADVNGDTRLDLLITTRGHGVRCFRNDGASRFQEVTAEAGLTSIHGSTSLALGDVNGDGALDLYVANFGVGSVLRDGGRITTRMVGGKLVVVGRMAKRVRIIDGKLVEFGEPDVLYLNDGKGRFSPVPWDKFVDENGKPMEAPWDFGLDVQIRDLNGDAWPDIYVCNDFFTPDRIWLNDQRGGFRAIPELAIRKTSYAAMGVDFADIDRDGHVDGLVVEMLARDHGLRLRQMTPDKPGPPVIGGLDRRPQAGRNTLFWNRGDTTFAEIAQFAGVAASDWSWVPVFVDVDLDGYEDLLIPNGHPYDLLDLDETERGRMADPRASGEGALRFPKIESPNCAFRNNGDRTFRETGKEWGFDSVRVSNGIALADLDNDGDLDVVVNCLNEGTLLYRNLSAAPRILVRLKGVSPNAQGIGAKITVRGGTVPMQSQELISGGRYLSGDDPVRVFAAGSVTNSLAIEVAWRSGRRSVITNVAANCAVEIKEPDAGEKLPSVPPPARPTLFSDASPGLGHVHHEEPYDDLDRQKLLPRRLSQMGPGVAWWDLDNDGHDELILGAGRGGKISVYRWERSGKFAAVPVRTGPVPSDFGGMTGFAQGGRSTLLIALSNYENPRPDNPLIGVVSKVNADSAVEVQLRKTAAVLREAIGPVAAGDIDGDGNLEIFAGGRVIPGRYPEAASSYILRLRGGELVVDAGLSAPFANLGLVSGGVFTDLTGDGLTELVLACEWGPLRVFGAKAGVLVERTAEFGLADYRGWWQSVAAADVDGDGKLDLIGGNWGLNSEYRCSREGEPLRMYYGDFNADGQVGILEAVFDRGSRKWLSGRDWRQVSECMPSIADRIPSHRIFSQTAVEDILGPRFSGAQKVEANELASMVFLNRGGKFEALVLPPEAQFAPAFGICAADFDGDGVEDLLLAQNCFNLPSEASRLDAGRGLLLKGLGAGKFRPVPGQESGVRVYGEQRGCAAADYDGDGRVDAVITQNGGSTHVFHNDSAEPGLRIRLSGAEGNPVAAGGSVRIGSGDRYGPAREIHLGAGYWSQDSLVQVMQAKPGNKIKVRWPGGKVTENEIPPGALEVEVGMDGIRVGR
jgi:hypothetical protein